MSLHLSKCHIAGNHIPRLIFFACDTVAETQLLKYNVCYSVAEVRCNLETLTHDPLIYTK